MSIYRTHTCAALGKENIGLETKLSGWVHSTRDHGGLLFIDLRDNYGITQCVIDMEEDKHLLDLAAKVSLESVIMIEGLVTARPPETSNPDLPTGEIEVRIRRLEILNPAKQLPFQVNDESQSYPEDLRLKYRYLDLRTQKMHRNIHMRSKVVSFLRKYMEESGFNEFQTPILTASSPEGARDFLVPSRIHPGKFYALPQAPQQFKQLLMASGFDKYFQIAPCFRDEDGRADRVLEFYQLDIEMSFVEEEDILNMIEPVFYNLFKQFRPDCKITEAPFPRITYRDAMLKYGIDKPDLRNPIEIADVTEAFRNSDFAVFAKAIENDKKIRVRAIPAPQVSNKPRSFFDKMVDFAISEGAKGLGYIIFDRETGDAKGPVAKFLDPQRLNKIKELAKLKDGDAVFFSCSHEPEAAKLAGKVRIRLGHELELIDENEYKFCFIVDFPLYETNEESGELDFAHNPFSMPKGGMEAFNTDNPLDIAANQYDAVCNGYEIMSGAIRNHRVDIIYKAFEMVGYPKDMVDDKFSGMVQAFQYGTPPHGGCAAGIDRLVMLLLDEPNLREVIVFPPNGRGVDLMMGAPSTINEKQLRELNIELSKKAKELLEKNNNQE